MGFFDIFIYLLIFITIVVSVFRKYRFEKNAVTDGAMRIYVVEKAWQCELACDYLNSDCQKLAVLGFDCEWVNLCGRQRPVALVQLASTSGISVLFRLNKLKNVPNRLKKILDDPNIMKVGIQPLNDAKYLLKDYDVKVVSTIDLRFLYPESTSLGALAYDVIGVTLDKSWQLRSSNWESPKLTETQKIYAAKDAWVAVEIFKNWLFSKTDLYFRGTNLNSLINENKLELQSYLDVPFKLNPHLPKPSNRHLFQGINSEKEKCACMVRKSPLYDNCFMNAPDGRLLCSCDKRKAQWYVDKGLAKVLPGEPYTIKLLFEPAARGDESSNGDFYRQLKQNCCVVCGASDSYLKHNVVPKEYRKHFPAAMKDHQSHDIVLMCVKCHYLANQHNENLKRGLAIFCNAPINRGRVTENKAVKKLRNCAKALLTAYEKIPQKRKLELENEIKEFFKTNSITPDILNLAVNLETQTVNDNKDSHGVKVVNYFRTSGGGLKNLELLWRKHFLNTMKPKHLPTFWSPTHNHSRLNI